MGALVSISPVSCSLTAGRLVRRGDRLVQRGDRAGGDRRGAALAARVAQRDHRCRRSGPWTESPRLTVGQAGRVLQLDHRHVVAGVVADDRGRVGLAVADVGDLDRGGAVDHVVVGQHLAVGGQHDAGAGRRRPPGSRRWTRRRPGPGPPARRSGWRSARSSRWRWPCPPTPWFMLPISPPSGGPGGQRHRAGDDQPALVARAAAASAARCRNQDRPRSQDRPA